jgi:hypothetical protein
MNADLIATPMMAAAKLRAASSAHVMPAHVRLVPIF